MEPQRSVRRRPFGVRLYLAVAFAAVALITAGLAYLLVSDTGEQAADEQVTQIAIGRTVTLADVPPTLHLRVFHDDDVEVYLNGVLAAKLPGATSSYAYVPLSAEARAALRPGPVVIAVHAHQARGGQFIDVGIADVPVR